jgi:hypothetical protein
MYTGCKSTLGRTTEEYVAYTALVNPEAYF